MKHVHEIDHNGLLWVNVTKQTEKELKEMQRRFGFLDADISEALPPFQRPKIVKRPNYYFIVLHFPVFDRETRRLGFTEIDIFLTANHLITVHENKLPVLGRMYDECVHDENRRSNVFSGTSVHVLFELISRLLDAIFPILLHVNQDINIVDKKLFSRTSGRMMAEEILRLKTNIVTFRRTMTGHRTVLERLIMYSGRELDIGAYQSYINDIREFTTEIWHMLESQKESIYALHEANESMLGLKTNEIMKMLTIISVVTFPLTLIATIFAIRAPGTPFVDWRGGFVLISLLIALGAGAMLLAFKKKDWL